MKEFRYDTYCGLYCGACDIMAIYKDSLKDGRKRAWDDLPEVLRNNLQVPRESEIKCCGCKTDTVFAGCRMCPIKKCIAEKHNVEVCTDCDEYPCWIYSPQGFQNEIVLERLPHVKSMIIGQKIIKEKGFQEWLALQEQEWKCPDCGKPFSWYTKTCAGCGRDVDCLKSFKK